MFISHRQRRKRMRIMLFMVIGIFLAVVSVLLWNPSSPIPTTKEWTPQQVVAQFYQYEQKGNFGSSWELLHPVIKEKYNKDTYIQRRAHVFMEDLGVDTFQFEMGQATAEASWKMSPLSPPLSNVTKIPVTLHYQSEFGDFKLLQDVYVVKEVEQYYIAWPFSRQK